MKRYPAEFLATTSNQVPGTLGDAIRRVANASAGFCASWAAGDHVEALTTSEEALGHLDHIQNELLRRRDERIARNAWSGTPFQRALRQHVGELLEPLTPADKTAFMLLPRGSGVLPTGVRSSPLQLSVALNKLKHMIPAHLNFTVTSSGGHMLFVLTHAGMGKPDSLCRIDVHAFCAACRGAEQAL